MKNKKNTQSESKNSYGNNFNDSSFAAYGTCGTSGKIDASPSARSKSKPESNSKKGSAKSILPAGNPASAGNVDRVSDPPVPNRAYTEM